jgi:hypothetical protein
MVTSYSRLATTKLSPGARNAGIEPLTVVGKSTDPRPGTDGQEMANPTESAPAGPASSIEAATPRATDPTNVPESKATLINTREEFRTIPSPMGTSADPLRQWKAIASGRTRQGNSVCPGSASLELGRTSATSGRGALRTDALHVELGGYAISHGESVPTTCRPRRLVQPGTGYESCSVS